MPRIVTALMVVLFTSIAFVGCQKKDGGSAGSNTDAKDSVTHTHAEGDELFWKREGIEDSGYTISLGHHGDHFHVGDEIEPAVMIVKDQKPVPNASIHNSLVSEDGTIVLVAENATVYEPETEDEPAHYAQGGLKIPSGSSKVQIQFRIGLPGVEGEKTYRIAVSLH